MNFNVDLIGVWAGQVWEAVDVADTVSIKQIKKITKLKDKEIFAALGWLARESKVSFQSNPDDEKDLLVQLVR